MINLNCEPPLNDVVAILGSSALRVCLMLFEAAKIDNRGNCGGLSCWSIKGLPNELSLHVRTVNSAIHKLLATGYIQIAGEQRNPGNSNNTIWRVTHPKTLESVRYAIAMMGPPSKRLKKMRTKQQKIDTSKYEEALFITGL